MNILKVSLIFAYFACFTFQLGEARLWDKNCSWFPGFEKNDPSNEKDCLECHGKEQTSEEYDACQKLNSRFKSFDECEKTYDDWLTSTGVEGKGIFFCCSKKQILLESDIDLENSWINNYIHNLALFVPAITMAMV